MRQLRTATLCVLAATAATAATPAFANPQMIRDDRSETKALKNNGRLDIVRVSVGHEGELLKYVVTMRKRVRANRSKERPLISLNVRGGSRSDPEFLVYGSAIFKTRGKKDPKRVGSADLSASGRRWTYLFDPAQINLKRYGWAIIATNGRAVDVAPASRYKNHKA